jgi:hypothetical protein
LRGEREVREKEASERGERETTGYGLLRGRALLDSTQDFAILLLSNKLHSCMKLTTSVYLSSAYGYDKLHVYLSSADVRR